MFFVLFLALLPLSASGGPYSCQSRNITLDEINTTFYLVNTQMASNQYCVWNFTFPSNYMAEIIVNALFMASSDSVKIFSQWEGLNNAQYIELSDGNASLHVMWPPSYFVLTIETDTKTTMTLAISVVLKLLSVGNKPTIPLTTAVNQQPNFVQLMEWKEDTTITVQAQTKSKVTATAKSPVSSGFAESLINIFIYDGTGESLQFCGTLYSLLGAADDDYYTSMIDTVTFYHALNNANTCTLIINDYENMRNLTYFDVDWSPYARPDIDYQQGIYLDASDGLAAITILNEADGSNAIYLQAVHYYNTRGCSNCTAPVILLAGGMVRDYNLTILSYYGEPEYFDDYSYPQYIPGMARTFVLEKGEVTLYYTSVAAYTKDRQAADKRRGFVISNNYPFKDQNQDSEDFVLNSIDENMFTFEYTIYEQNPNWDSYLNFSLAASMGTNNFSVNLNTVTPGTFNVTALEMTMKIIGGSAPSTGTYISFTIFSTANFTDFTTTASQTTEMTVSSTDSTASPPSGKFPLLVIFVCLGILALLAVIIVIIVCLRYQIRRGKHRKFWVTVSGVLPITTKIDEWELGEKQLEIFEDKELGRGAFGVVFEGKLSGSRPVDKIVPSALRIKERISQVAVKRLPSKADAQAKLDFMSEMEFMKKLGYHAHILGMIGCMTSSGLPLIVLEYCENGDLLLWVRKQKYSTEELGSAQLLSIAWQISDGLCYLKSINLLHRDLAARNVLLTRELAAKISDFGLSREPEKTDDAATYLPSFYVSRGGRLPIKWMAPEALRSFQFTFKTDVWSYGVVLWEMFTFGDVPFASVLAPALLDVLESGERLPKGRIPDPIYKLMLSCWDAEPGKRETIEKIRDTLHGMVASSSNDYGYLMISSTSEEDEC